VNKGKYVIGSSTDVIDSDRSDENNRYIVELYQTYNNTMAHLENKLLQKLREAKLFTQDGEDYSGRAVALQTNYFLKHCNMNLKFRLVI